MDRSLEADRYARLRPETGEQARAIRRLAVRGEVLTLLHLLSATSNCPRSFILLDNDSMHFR